ncbi:MAG: hypothetical protein R3B09_26670 [Nannocystaceae bacterium]
MTEVKVTQFTRIDDPKLRALADDLAEGILAAAWKAAAHHAAPQECALPARDTLERRFLHYLRARPAAVQQKVAARGLSLIRERKVPGLVGVDLRGPQAAMSVLRPRLKIVPLTARPTSPAHRVPPIVDGGLPGFRKQDAPTELTFEVVRVHCVTETTPRVGEDEIAIGGLMIDAAGNTVKIPRKALGDYESGTRQSFHPGKPLARLDFPGPGGWPRSFSLVLTLAEIDNGGFPELLDELFNVAREEITDVVREAAHATLGERLGDWITSAIQWVLETVFGALKDWWEDDLFAPATFNFEFADAGARFNGSPELGLFIEWTGHGGRYRVELAAELGPIADAGHGELFKVLGDGNLRTVAAYTRWRQSWTEIVPLDRALLFYDARAGVIEIYKVDGGGDLTLLRQHAGIRKTWSELVPGNFSGQGGAVDLFCYDAAAGLAEFYAIQSDGGLRLLRQHTGFRKTWRHIVPGDFGGNGYTDLLFYDAGAGEGEFYATDGAGGVSLLARHTGWRRSWKWILPGAFGGDARTDLLFYDMQAGEAECYAVSGGQMSLLRRHSGWRKTWMQAVTGSFASGNYTDLLLYDPTAGVGEFHRGGPGGPRQLLHQHTTWRRSWTRMVALKFAGNDYLHDLVFYDRRTADKG